MQPYVPGALAAAAIAAVLLWRAHRKLRLDVDTLKIRVDAGDVRTSIQTKRVDLLCHAAREERDRDPERTVRMSAHELARAKRGRSDPDPNEH